MISQIPSVKELYALDHTRFPYTRPVLWVSERVSHPSLDSSFAGICTPLHNNPEDTEGGHHIICLHPEASEFEIKSIALPLIATNRQVSVFKPSQRLRNMSPNFLHALVLDLLEAEDYRDWARKCEEYELRRREAISIARLLLKYAVRDTLAEELEELRERARMKPFDWGEAIRKIEKAYQSESSGKGSDKTRILLELQAIAQCDDFIQQTTQIIEFCQRTRWTRRDVEQWIRLFKANTATQQGNRMKIKDFIPLETEALKWIFPGTIPSRGVVLIGGHAGAGKTTLAYDAVGSLLLKEEFLGEKPVRSGKVLIVTGDELPCFTQDKLIDRGIPVDNDDGEIILHWDISQWALLEETIADIRPALVVIDSFASIHRDPNFDENTSQAKNTISNLEALTNTYNCGCILIHHLAKSPEMKGVSKLRGSSAISAAASVVILMEEWADGTRKLTFPKVRGARTETVSVALNEFGRYEIVSEVQDSTPEVKSLCDEVLCFLQQMPHARFETEEIADACGVPRGSDSLYKALSRLHRRGMIVKKPALSGGKRKVYGIPANLAPEAIPDTFTQVDKVNSKIIRTPPFLSEESVRKNDGSQTQQDIQFPDTFLTPIPDTLARTSAKEPIGSLTDTFLTPIPDTLPDATPINSPNPAPTAIPDTLSADEQNLPKFDSSLGLKRECQLPLSQNDPLAIGTTLWCKYLELNATITERPTYYNAIAEGEDGSKHEINLTDLKRKIWVVRK